MQSEKSFIWLTMDSFRVYLPSNASMDLFPDNKPSDYKIQMNPPLQLNGNWEVGVENVCYHSNIANTRESETLTVRTQTYGTKPINEVYNYPYVLTKDGKWNYDWMQFKSNFYGDLDKSKIIDALNSGNKMIMKDERKKVYKFYISRWRGRPFYTFKSFSSGFAMRISSGLMQHLGFGYSEHVFNNGKGNVEKKSGKIDKSNYWFRIFDSNVVECEERIILKKRDEKPLSLTALVQRWNETVGKKYGEKSEGRKNKFILHKHSAKITVIFSPSLCGVVRHYTPLIGGGTFWGSNAYTIPKQADNEEWYVDIYGDRIKTIRQKEKQIKSEFVFPVREYSTVQDLIRRMNSHIEYMMKTYRSNYDVEKHRILFEIDNQKTVLKLGSDVTVHLTENFAKLFRFINQTFSDRITISLESPMTLDKREQHLFIQSDLISPILFGDKKEYILRGFIHDKDSTFGIMEKLFDPILYLPVAKEDIPFINIRITNGLRERIHLRDTKSLITLVFRRAK